VTKRGSIVYYLSAWVFGCFFTSALVGFFGREHMIHFEKYPASDPVRDFLSVFLTFLVTGGASALVFGFLLRWTMVRFKCLRAAQWIVAGASISLPLCYLVAKIGPLLLRGSAHRPEWLGVSELIILAGPGIAFDNGPLLIVPAGALTASVLFLVNRAFDPRQSPGA
jgi:hypothetical protein